MPDAVFVQRFEKWLKVTGLNRVELARLVDRAAGGCESGREKAELARAVALGMYGPVEKVVPPLLLDVINEYAERIRREANEEMRSAVELRHATDALIASATQAMRTVSLPTQRSTDNPQAPLTGRERQILYLIANALSNRQIAVALSISEKTVKNHITSLFAKLGVSARTEALVVALRDGMLVAGHRLDVLQSSPRVAGGRREPELASKSPG